MPTQPADALKNMRMGLWVQPDGPNTVPRYLGCHEIGSVSRPLGGNTLQFCKDINGGYEAFTLTKDAPGLVTFTVNTFLRKVRDYAATISGCPVPWIVTGSFQGELNDPVGWDVAFVYRQGDVTNVSRDNFVGNGNNGQDMVMQSFDIEALGEVELHELRANRDGDVTETTAFNKVFQCINGQCASQHGARKDVCDTLYAVSDAVVGSASGTADVWINTDGTWTVAAADPFDTDEDIITGACLSIDKDTTRIIVFRGTTDGAAAAEAAYSDDGGATWINVTIGATTGEFVSSPHALYVLDRYNMWVGTDSGRIYFSSDQGVTWAVQENAGIHSGAWNWIEFVDERNGYAGGAADVLAYTIDGGVTWSQLSATGGGGDILSGAALDAQRLWVGTDDGELFYTLDGGTTWTERTTFTGSGTGDVKDVYFQDEMLGYILHNTAAPKGNIFQTIDGGYTWRQIATVTNAGLNSMMSCSERLLWAVGEPQGGTAVAFKVQEL